MTTSPRIDFAALDLDRAGNFAGTVAVLVSPDGKETSCGRADLFREQIGRFAASSEFSKLKTAECRKILYPHGSAADSLVLVKLPAGATAAETRKAGAGIAASAGKSGLLVLAGRLERIGNLAEGIALRSYTFDRHRTSGDDGKGAGDMVTIMADQPGAAEDAYRDLAAAVGGVHAARDLVNEPANVLSTTEYARRMEILREDGLSVTIMDEDRLRELGMGALLAVGAASTTPSRAAVIEWKNASGPPLALIGKGVVFDTGGISLKPAAKMEEMTMDMAGSAVVAGVMQTLARRKAKANVVGLLGLVENMPGGNAQRPGDVVKTMKGDTVEVTNTDAEGRLVLADLLWYAQQTYGPSAMIDLATLTGAIIVGLGNDLAGVFANDDEFFADFRAAADHEDELCWRMPLHDPYDKLLKSRVADIQNVGGRGAGAITAAQFLKRFVKPEIPWMHMDIAGVAYSGSADGVSPKGGTGWGVRAIDRLIRTRFETGG